MAGKLRATSIQRLHDIFDFSPETLAKRPDVEQFPLERMPDAARGIPEHVKKLGGKRNLDRMDSYVQKGLEAGSQGWYNTEQLRQYFQAELGADEGAKAYETFIGMVAASSPGARTPINTKIASHYYQRDRQGEKIVKGDPIPDGYGHVYQKNHQDNAATIQNLGHLDSKKNPKVESFRNNLLGNQEPLTADRHNLRALGYTDTRGKLLDSPEASHYGFIERIQQDRAEKMGLRTAEYQEGAWVGAGDVTGLRSPPDPFLKIFEDRVGLTAEQMGLPKEEVLRRVIRGEIPLKVVVNPVGAAKTLSADQPGNSPSAPSAPSADDGYKAEPIAPGTSLKDLGMPEFSKPEPGSVYKPIDMPVDRDVRLEDLPPGFAITEEGVRDPQGKPAKFRSPSVGQVLSKLGTDILPVAGGTLPVLARGAIGAASAVDKVTGFTTGSGPMLQGRLRQAEQPIAGVPSKVKIPGEGEVAARPIVELQQAADSYMAKAGRPGEHAIEQFKALDEDKARRIAQAYEAMQHAPNDPAVRRAYDAMIEETMGQYRALKDLGLEFKANPPGHDPYAASPAMGYADLIKNGRLNFFPTEQGFGSLGSVTDNPLLKRVGPIGDLPNATANDAFRVVHDAFGHFAPGNPFFRAPGEERAWQAHKRMYSPEAAPAMTAETRGQNSWLNYGPHGEQNRTAASSDTVFAEQKAGLLPSWTMIPAMAGTAVLGGSLATLGQDEQPEHNDFVERYRAKAKAAPPAEKRRPDEQAPPPSAVLGIRG